MKIKLTETELINSYEKLEVRAQFDLDFIFLTSIAAVICAFGFRMNSASVIIGAMVLSPLLLPVVGIGASLFRKRWKNFFKNFFALIYGLAIAILASYIINFFFPTVNASEIAERLIGDPLDYFFVAFFSGLGGTYAFFWPGIMEAVTGIAISVALIPPVVLIGVGLLRWDIPLLTGSLEIAFVNIIGIMIGSFIMVILLNIYAKKKINTT